MLQYLLHYTDEEHAAGADTIAAYLDNDCGISAERRSIYRAIAEERQEVENRHGEKYVVSPYKLLINNGYYYLLAYEDKRKRMITYRLDRMRNVSLSGVPRDGQEVFDRLDMQSYIQRTFSMFSGEERLVRIRFINPMLDTAVDRFGTKGVQYSTDDKRHFIVSAKVAISPQFYGWLLGFGNRAKLLYPDDVVADFKTYIDKVQKMYES